MNLATYDLTDSAKGLRPCHWTLYDFRIFLQILHELYGTRAKAVGIILSPLCVPMREPFQVRLNKPCHRSICSELRPAATPLAPALPAPKC